MIAPSSKTTHEHEWPLPPSKRKRTDDEDEHSFQTDFEERPRFKLQGPHAEKHGLDGAHDALSIPSTASALAAQAVGPFYARHIPTQYNPQGDKSSRPSSSSKDLNTKFCYRHRPDLLCRRQADEPSMDELQQGLEALPQDDKQAIVSVWSLFSAAPAKQRSLMLQGILTQCCFPQLSMLAHNVRELIRIDFLSALPSEISFKILCFLDTTSLCKAAQVSRKWRQLADDDVVWHRMCEQHIDRKCTKCGWGLPLLDRKRLRASKRQMQLRAAGRGMNEWSPAITPVTEVDENTLVPPQTILQPVLPALLESEKLPSRTSDHDHNRKTRPWKDVYRDRFRVGSNWKHGRCTERVLRGHTNGIMAIQMLDNILATGSYDNTIKIWDLDTGAEIRTLRGHTMGVRCLQLDDSKLISGSMDKTVKIWNWRTGECVRTIHAHQDSVIGLHLDNQFLVTGSADRTAKVFTFGTEHGSSVTLRGHNEWVNSVKIDTASRTVFTASDDFTVKMWDLDTHKCIRTYKGHTAHVQQVQLLPHDFDLEDDGTAATADPLSPPGSPQSHYTGTSTSFGTHDQSPVLTHSSPAARMESDSFALVFDGDRPKPPRYMATSGLDAQIRIWEIHTGRCVRTLFGHIEGVWALAADMLRLVSGAEDRVVKVWDARTGRCEGNFTGHSGPVTCLALSDSRMCSGSEDGEVRVYCFNN